MPCVRVGNAICCFPEGPYKYKGIYWEWHSYFGPHPIYKRTFEPWKKVPDYVWRIATEFAQEPDRNIYLVEK